MQALFKARFEQALDSQKLNIKKIEQQLRRKGVNPEDPIAMASIQRVASTFFRAIDEKQGTPYVFRGDRQPTAADGSQVEGNDNQAPTDLSPEDSDQEELDRFIADIEDAADREWETEEAAKREEASKIRYWGKDDAGMMRGRNPNWRGANSEEDYQTGRGDKQRNMEIRKWDSGDEISDASDGGESEDYGDEYEEKDVRVKLASNRPAEVETSRQQNGSRLSEASSGSDNDFFCGSDGDELWESPDEKDDGQNVSKFDACDYDSGSKSSRASSHNQGRKVEISKSKRNIDEDWDSD